MQTNSTELPIDLPVAPPVLIERRQGLVLADLDAEGIRALVTELNERAETVGCIIFGGRADAQDVVSVIFAGNIERFYMLPVARDLTGPVIYIQDLQSGWYQGSPVLPDLHTLCRTVLIPEIGDRACLFFGQSSGGYAALAASAFFPKATVLACAPQTFSDAEMKARMNFIGIRCLSTPAGLIDLRAAFIQATGVDALREVVIAASEFENPYTAHYWMDYLHALRIADLPTIRVSIVNASSHVIVHGRLNLFAKLLRQLEQAACSEPSVKSGLIDAFLSHEFASKPQDS